MELSIVILAMAFLSKVFSAPTSTVQTTVQTAPTSTVQTTVQTAPTPVNTTTPVDLCYCHDTPYDPLVEIFFYSDCTYCVDCGEVRQIDCAVECVNPEPEVENDGYCCPICPDGPNCETEGVIIPYGDQVIIGNKSCECGILSLDFDPYDVFCIEVPPVSELLDNKPMSRAMGISTLILDITLLLAVSSAPPGPTTPLLPPPPCYCYDKPYYPSSERFIYSDCISCVECGTVEHADCIVTCADPKPEVENDGICCPECPNGSNCKKDGVIIPHGEAVKVGDELCQCQPIDFFYDPHEVNCIPIPPSAEEGSS